jgi:serine/threonine-protein kinase RsbW
MIEQYLTRTLLSTQKSVDELQPLVENFVSQGNLPPDCAPTILVSLTEAVNNAIIHGNCNDSTKAVEVKMACNEQGVSVSVSDQGNGFNPDAIADPTSPENIVKCGGRGVYIMKSLSHGVKYSDNGSTVEMFFRILP